jgi:insertion element IS1 protein InsB
MQCPACDSEKVVKNGINATGKQNHLCNECHRQFVVNPINTPISDDIKELIDHLLLERISLAGIARVVGVSESWLQEYVNAKYCDIPHHVVVPPAGKYFQLVVERDEMWSFVGKKDKKQWLWFAKDRHTGYVVGVYVGPRSTEGAQGLWDSLPAEYKERAIYYTDFWESYRSVFPESRHRPCGKESGQTIAVCRNIRHTPIGFSLSFRGATERACVDIRSDGYNHIERFNCTLRQRVSRLVRKALSFSKKLDNHIGAIWYFIHHYNAQILVAI